MDETLISVTPNKEKAVSILRMVQTTLERIKQTEITVFSSNVTKDYYEILRELISVLLLLDGFKAIGEGAHKCQIEYLDENYKEFSKANIELIDSLRIIRNRIAYDGFFVKESYIQRRLYEINSIITKLNCVISKKLA